MHAYVILRVAHCVYISASFVSSSELSVVESIQLLQAEPADTHSLLSRIGLACNSG